MIPCEDSEYALEIASEGVGELNYQTYCKLSASPSIGAASKSKQFSSKGEIEKGKRSKWQARVIRPISYSQVLSI